MYFPVLFSSRKNVLWKIIDGSLCVFQKSAYNRVNEYEKKWSLAFLPIPFNHSAFEECINILDAFNRTDRHNIHNISDSTASHVQSGIKYNIRLTPDGRDYIYDVSRSKSLAGSEYKKIRYHVAHFEKEYHPKTDSYNPEMYRECLRLFNSWKKRKLEQDNVTLYKEHTNEMLKELRMFDDMFGIVVRVNNELAAFSLGGGLIEKNQMGVCIIRKTETGMKGLSEFIDWNFYNYLPGRISTVNDGDDCFSQSLADYKSKWRPARIQPIFKATACANSNALHA